MSNPVATSRARPIKITREWFRQRYGQNFPDLLKPETDELLDSCIDEVYTKIPIVTKQECAMDCL